MMDPTVQPRAAFDTAPAYGAGRSERQPSEPGFSDALKGADRKPQQSNDKKADSGHAAGNADTADQDDMSGPVGGDEDGLLQASADSDDATAVEDTPAPRRVRIDQPLHLFKAAQQADKATGNDGTAAETPNAGPEGKDDEELSATPDSDEKQTRKAIGEVAGKPVKGAGDPQQTAEARDTGKEVADAADGDSDSDDMALSAGDAGMTDQASGSTTATDALMLLIVGKASDAVTAEAAAALKPVAANDGNDIKGADADIADTRSTAELGKQDTVAADLSKLLTGKNKTDDQPEVPATTDESKGAEFKAIRLDRLANAQDGQMRDRDGASAGGSATATPTVAVLESRRYIAPVSTSNAANLAAAMSGDRDWVNLLRSGAIDSATQPDTSGKVMNSLKLQMNPIDLGSVTATLKLTGETLNVQLTVENSAAYRKLSADHSEIVKSLRSQGYAVDSVQISIVSTDRSGAGSNQTSGQQQGQQQAGQQQPGSQSFAGTPQGSGGGRGEGSFSSSANGNSQTGLTGDDGMAAGRGEGGTSGARSGSGVYL